MLVAEARYNQIAEQITYIDCDVITGVKVTQSVTFCYWIFSQLMDLKCMVAFIGSDVWDVSGCEKGILYF